MATTTAQRELLPEVAEDLLYTTEICRHALPDDTHPINLARIKVIRQLIVWATRAPDAAAYWAEQMRRAEHAVDVQGGAK